MKHIALAMLALAAHLSAQTRADQMLDAMPRHYATERAPAYLDRINRQVNRMGLIDCKAHVFEKLRRIEAYGYGPDRARFWPVRTPGQPANATINHAVVVVERHWVMDSLIDEVVTVDDLRRMGYQVPPLP